MSEQNVDNSNVQDQPILCLNDDGWYNDTAKQSSGRRTITIGQQRKSISEWAKLAQINLNTIQLRIKRGVLAVTALITPNANGNRLHFVIPSPPWTKKIYHNGKVTIEPKHADGAMSGVEVMYDRMFGENGYRNFEDILREFTPGDQSSLLDLKSRMSNAIKTWNENGRPKDQLPDIIHSCPVALLQELYLRRQANVVLKEDRPMLTRTLPRDIPAADQPGLEVDPQNSEASGATVEPNRCLEDQHASQELQGAGTETETPTVTTGEGGIADEATNLELPRTKEETEPREPSDRKIISSPEATLDTDY